MQYVDCVYRVHEEGEILSGIFDIQEGVIRGRPELLKVDLGDKYEFVDTMYTELDTRTISPITKCTLINVMCKKPKSLLILNYNNIGVIIVYRDRMTHWIFARQSLDYDVYSIKDPICLKDVRVLGIMRSKLKTLSVVQPYFKVIGLRWKDGIERVYTDTGVYKLEKGLSPYKELDVEAYKNMLVDGLDIYGLVTARNKSYYLIKRGDEMVYSSERRNCDGF